MTEMHALPSPEGAQSPYDEANKAVKCVRVTDHASDDQDHAKAAENTESSAPHLLNDARKVFRNRAIAALFSDALHAFDELYAESKRHGAPTDRLLTSFQPPDRDLVRRAMNMAAQKSKTRVAFFSCLAAATQLLWKHGRVPHCVHDVLYDVEPAAYRKMVESVLAIRAELGRDMDDICSWDKAECEEVDEVPKAFQTEFYDTVVAMPTLRLYRTVIKGRAVTTNLAKGTRKRKREEDEAPEEYEDLANPSDLLWDKFLGDLD